MPPAHADEPGRPGQLPVIAQDNNDASGNASFHLPDGQVRAQDDPIALAWELSTTISVPSLPAVVRC
jgi:hypothetical protein